MQLKTRSASRRPPIARSLIRFGLIRFSWNRAAGAIFLTLMRCFALFKRKQIKLLVRFHKVKSYELAWQLTSRGRKCTHCYHLAPFLFKAIHESRQSAGSLEIMTSHLLTEFEFILYRNGFLRRKSMFWYSFLELKVLQIQQNIIFWYILHNFSGLPADSPWGIPSDVKKTMPFDISR